MNRSLITISLLIGFAYTGELMAWPWSTDMGNQLSTKPQEPITTTKPGAVLQMQPFPQRSVPVGVQRTLVKSREEADTLVNPVAATIDSLKKGQVLYDIYCSACHGYTGGSTTPVSEKIYAVPLLTDRVQKEISEGWLWGTITFGGAIMPAYGAPSRTSGGSNDLTVEERWHVVNYVRNGLRKVQP